MKKKYLKPNLEIIKFDEEIKMANTSVTINYPWQNETYENNLFN